MTLSTKRNPHTEKKLFPLFQELLQYGQKLIQEPNPLLRQAQEIVPKAAIHGLVPLQMIFTCTPSGDCRARYSSGVKEDQALVCLVW